MPNTMRDLKVTVFLADPLVVDYSVALGVDRERLKLAYEMNLVVGAEAPDEDILETVFYTFNMNHPADYDCRSLSVGDVVTLDSNRSYVCAPVGWQPVTPAILPANKECQPTTVHVEAHRKEPCKMQTVILTTDGACHGNPGPGGWACILRIGNTERELTGREPHTTNNRMEMTAAIRGLMALEAPSDVEIVTDSKYLLQGATEFLPRWKRNDWRTSTGKPVLNQDLWLELEIQIKRHKVRWTWVRGHQDHATQNKCDRLASMAARGQRARNAEQA